MIAMNMIFGLFRFIHEHERTQLDMDEEIIRSFDKLYPHNFRLFVKPELLEGIVRKMNCAEENGMNSKHILILCSIIKVNFCLMNTVFFHGIAKCMDAQCAKIEEEDCKNRVRKFHNKQTKTN